MHKATINHPGTATPTGGGTTSGGSITGGTSATPFTVNPQAMAGIAGDPVELRQIATAFLAGATKFGDAHAAASKVHNTVFQDWKGNSALEGERATKMAVGRAKYALDAMNAVHPAINTFANELQVAQTKWANATNSISTTLAQNPLAASTDQSTLQGLQNQALAAQQDAATARRKVEAAIVHASTVQWYTVPKFTARFDPITAAILDSLVAHHWVSRANAQAVAGRLGKLSKTDYAKFSKLASTATSDKERGKLYTQVATGVPMTKIVSADKKFHAAPVHHAPAVSTSGGVSAPASVSPAVAVAPAVVAPAVTYRPSTSPSKSPSKAAPAHHNTSAPAARPAPAPKAAATAKPAFNPHLPWDVPQPNTHLVINGQYVTRVPNPPAAAPVVHHNTPALAPKPAPNMSTGGGNGGGQSWGSSTHGGNPNSHA